MFTRLPFLFSNVSRLSIWRRGYHVHCVSWKTKAGITLLPKDNPVIPSLQFRNPRLLFTSAYRSQTNDSVESLYNKFSEETLELLCETFEEIIDNSELAGDADVSLSNGVLSVHLGSHGTYVINKQTPNKQIWLSSPKSGPKRFDLIDHRWIYKHDGKSLDHLLNQEISEILGASVDFTTKLKTHLKHLE